MPLGPVAQLAIQALPMAFVGWLGIWLFVRSAGGTGAFRGFGGPFTFLFIWGITVFANFETRGKASPVLDTLCFTLLALGVLTTIVHALMKFFRRSHRH